MKKLAKKVVLLLIGLCPAVASAQSNVEAEIEADIVSKNVYRGLDQGGPVIMPRGEVRWQGLFLRGEAATGFNDNTTERIDVQLGYRAPFGLNIGVGSHWVSGIDGQNRYFYFDEHYGAQQIEANIGFTHRLFSLQAYTIFAGNDFKIDGDRAFSTFVELCVPFRLAGLQWQARAAVTPMESSGWFESYYDPELQRNTQIRQYRYADTFACTEVALRAQKDLTLTGFKLPLFVEMNVNPYTQRMFFMGGITIRPFQKCCKKEAYKE